MRDPAGGPALPRVAALSEAALLLLTALVYAPVLGYGFAALDDGPYVLANRHVQRGLDASTLSWAFRSFEAANWHPLTWLSHALDAQLYGLWAGGHHATSLALHLVTVALMFSALRALTGATWRSLAVAALFALHPMNVQSVVWISERKNVLSGAFFAATLLAYASYARRPIPARYLAVTLAFALGLMAKPMLVTVPFVLLLLDAWPLGRLTGGERWSAVREKVPWLAMSAVSSLLTVRAQSGAIATLQQATINERVCTVLRGGFSYLEKLFWPAGLAVHYPALRAACDPVPVALAAATLLIITTAAVLCGRRRPWLPVGWAWFTGMLVPVCGLVQVGPQFIADRYVYLPMVGCAVAVVWGVAEVGRRATSAVAPIFFVVVLALAWRSSTEVAYWRTDEALFDRALTVTGPPNCVADTILGAVARHSGNGDSALFHWSRAVASCPGDAEARRGLGTLLAERGDLARAAVHLRVSVALEPASPAAHFNLGLVLWNQGRTDEARREFERTLSLEPGHVPAAAMIRRIPGGAPDSPR